MNVKLLLVDDHPMLINGLRQAVATRPYLTLVGEATTGESALQLAETLAPDLIVMAVHLPGMSGIEATRQILRAHASIKIVIFSYDAARFLVDQALEVGARGYILKSSSVEEVVHAIDEVIAGKIYLSPDVGAGILADYRRKLVAKGEPPKPLLSDREKGILRLIVEGLPSKEIATKLKLSKSSIERYRAHLIKKLGCSGTTELVRYAIREGFAIA